MSHTRIAPSRQPAANCIPSGLKLRPSTVLPFPRRMKRLLLLRLSRYWTQYSLPVCFVSILDVGALQQLGGSFVQLIGASEVFEAGEQVLGA